MRLLAATCLALGFATPAHADWQGFEWGMTEEQVEAAKSDVTVYRLETEKRRKTYPSFSTLGGIWTEDGQEYQVYFYFDADRRLRDVDVELGAVECSQLNENLSERFGRFEEEVRQVGPAQQTVRRWRLGKSAELMATWVHFPSTDKWMCAAKIKKPVGR